MNKKLKALLIKLAKEVGIELDEKELDLVEAQTEDGQTISAPSWEAGQPITIEVDGESQPLPLGEYVIDGVGIIVVETEGIIAQVKSFDMKEEKTEQKEEAKTEEKKEEKKEELKDEDAPVTKKDLKDFAANLSDEEEKKETKKVALAKVIKPSPDGKTTLSDQAGRFKFPGRGMNDYRQKVLNSLYGEDSPRRTIKMATTTSITTTYAGQFAGDYIAAALLSAETIANGGLTIHANIALKKVLKKLAVTDIVKDATCDFDPTSTVTLTEKILTPEELQVNLALCKKDFVQDWESESMGYSAYKNMPPNFSEFFISHIIAMVAEWNEQKIWTGVTGNDGEFDGFLTLMAADGDVVDVAAPAAGGITKANVIAELRKVTAVIPDELFGKPDLSLYVPTNVIKAYTQALGGDMTTVAGYMVQGPVGEKPLNIDGVNIFHAPGMTASYVVAAQASNLYFGTGLMSDQNEVKVLDMEDKDLSQNVRFAMRYTAAVQYGYGAECVLYTPGA